MAWLPDADEVLILPVEDLAMHLLKRIAQKPHHAVRATRFTSRNGEVLSQGVGYHKPEVIKALGEAFDWLYVNGLIAVSPNNINEGHFEISRKGLRIAAEADSLTLMNSEHLLSLTLHPAIDQKARVQFAIGAYGSAVFEAFRSLEIRVRNSAGLPAKVLGDDVMRLALSPTESKKGPLTDPSLEFAQQRAVMEFFAGAIGTFKNPLSHHVVDYDDPTIAAEQVMFADLLHRMLDGLEAAKAERDAEQEADANS